MPIGGPDWPGPGPFRPQRFIANWPKFQFAYPNRVRVTAQYTEIISSGDPAAQFVRVTDQYLEVVTPIPLTPGGYLGARGGKWPGAGPNPTARFVGNWPKFQYAYPPSTAAINVSPALTGVAGIGHTGAFTAQIAAQLAGIAATGRVGSFAEQQAAQLVGVFATGRAGGFVHAVQLAGVAAIGVAGNLRDQEGINLASVAARGAIGQFTVPDRFISISGVFATGRAGILHGQQTVRLAGVAAFGRSGQLFARLAPAQGARATGRQNVFRPSLAHGITGTRSIGTAGTITGRLSSVPILAGVRAIGRAADLHTLIVVPSKGHGHGHGAQGSLSITLTDVFALGRAGKFGTSIAVAHVTTVNLLGVRALGTFGIFGLSVGHRAGLPEANGTAAVHGLAPALAKPLAGVPAAGHVGSLASRIAPSIALRGVAGQAVAGFISWSIVEATRTLLGEPPARAFGHTGQFTTEIDRGLLTPAVNEAIGQAGEVEPLGTTTRTGSRATAAAGQFGVRIDAVFTLQSANAFAACSFFNRDVNARLSAAAAQGQVGDLTLALVLPQAPLECELNATVTAGDIGAIITAGDLAAIVAAGDLGGSIAANAIAFDVFANDLAADVRCED